MLIWSASLPIISFSFRRKEMDGKLEPLHLLNRISELYDMLVDVVMVMVGEGD